MMTACSLANDVPRLDFLQLLTAIPGINIAPSRISGSPYVRLEHFTSDAAQRRLLGTLAWVDATIRTPGRTADASIAATCTAYLYFRP